MDYIRAPKSPLKHGDPPPHTHMTDPSLELPVGLRQLGQLASLLSPGIVHCFSNLGRSLKKLVTLRCFQNFTSPSRKTCLNLEETANIYLQSHS